MTAAELGIGARVTGVTQRDVGEELWERRRLVKTYSLRGTVHLHPAAELPLWTAARQALPDWRERRWHESYGLESEQAEAVLEAIREALDGGRLTREELPDEVTACVGSWAGERLASTWADLIGLGFDAGLLCFGPSQGSKVTFVRTDRWLDEWKEMDPGDALVEVFRRYVAAYGPVTHQDFARWFAPRQLKPDQARGLVASLSGELEEVEVEGQRGWIATSDADMPSEQPDASLRLLPQYDCYLIGCRFGRDHIIPERARSRVFAYKNGRFEEAVGLPVLLIDGVVAGM